MVNLVLEEGLVVVSRGILKRLVGLVILPAGLLWDGLCWNLHRKEDPPGLVCFPRMQPPQGQGAGASQEGLAATHASTSMARLQIPPTVDGPSF